MKLSDLMWAWGDAEGLNQQEVLRAIGSHCFHEGDVTSLRFSIINDKSNTIIIKVHPKRDKGDKGSTPSGSNGMGWGGQQGSRRRNKNRSTPEKVTARGSILLDPSCQKLPSLQGMSGPPKSTEDKLSMSLDEVIRCEREDSNPGRLDQGDDLPPWSEVHRNPFAAQRVQRSMEQMGLTPGTQHVRLAPRIGPRHRMPNREVYAGERRSNNNGSCTSTGEKAQKWLSYVLKAGYRDLNIAVEDGWAQWKDLAAAINQTRRDLGEFDESSLRDLIHSSDNEYRFQLDDMAGRVRKVPKEQRRPQGAGATEAVPRCGEVAGPDLNKPPGRSRSISSDSSGSGAHWHASGRRGRGGGPSRSASPAAMSGCGAEDAALAERAQRSLNVGGETGPRAGEGQAVEGRGANQKPPPPPGPGWTNYQDPGDGSREWWHHTGPPGAQEWYCPVGDPTRVEPYPPEEAQEEVDMAVEATGSETRAPEAPQA